tara:strand:+ start:19475 stop:19801 length:327 start_codon:yes stop_codon:yes gene_type:complete
MKYVFDLDGTLCTNTDGKYKDAKPIQERINKVNKLYDEGNEIIILTARGMGRYKNDCRKAYNHFYTLTKNQLSEWGIKHHDLFLGKPSGDIYIDDKGERDENFFNTRD